MAADLGISPQKSEYERLYIVIDSQQERLLALSRGLIAKLVFACGEGEPSSSDCCQISQYSVKIKDVTMRSVVHYSS